MKDSYNPYSVMEEWIDRLDRSHHRTVRDPKKGAGNLHSRNDITTLASYDQHGSDSILSPQCNSWKVIHFSLII